MDRHLCLSLSIEAGTIQRRRTAQLLLKDDRLISKRVNIVVSIAIANLSRSDIERRTARAMTTRTGNGKGHVDINVLAKSHVDENARTNIECRMPSPDVLLNALAKKHVECPCQETCWKRSARVTLTRMPSPAVTLMRMSSPRVMLKALGKSRVDINALAESHDDEAARTNILC